MSSKVKMGDLDETGTFTSEIENFSIANTQVWEFGSGLSSWQSRSTSIMERNSHLFNNSEMSDLSILACDENWWFGQTVKDFSGHQLVLASASPVFHRLLYQTGDVHSGEEETKLELDSRLGVTLTLTPTYSGRRLEMDGIPPIAAEALLEYIYKDKFSSSDFENGFSRNLLWRLWHASKAFEIEHLNKLCTQTINDTICEDTVFWDLNYSIEYKALGVDETMTKVLKLMEDLTDRLYNHPNFVWLHRLAVKEILLRRKFDTCEPVVVLNNLLRWSMYQVDRTACCEVDEKSNGEIPIDVRIEWIQKCRERRFDHVDPADLEKYIRRGTEFMPWTELSQADFLKTVVPNSLISEEDLLNSSIQIMQASVENPDRLFKSAFQVENEKKNGKSDAESIHASRRSTKNRSEEKSTELSKTSSEDVSLLISKPISPA